MKNIDIGFIAIWFVALLFSLSFHEAAHAWTSNKFGDDTGRLQGRITLNPVAHIDPFGTILFPLVSAFTSLPLLGWAKPVQTNPNLWRDKTKANIAVSAAGPISNFIIAAVTFVVLKILFSMGILGFTAMPANVYNVIVAIGDQGVYVDGIARVLNVLLVLNIALGVFNFLPIPPLDGSHVLESLLPGQIAEAFAQIRPFGIFILLALMATGLLSFISIPIIFILRLI